MSSYSLLEIRFFQIVLSKLMSPKMRGFLKFLFHLRSHVYKCFSRRFDFDQLDYLLGKRSQKGRRKTLFSVHRHLSFHLCVSLSEEPYYFYGWTANNFEDLKIFSLKNFFFKLSLLTSY